MRKGMDIAFRTAVALCAVMACGILALMVTAILIRGLPSVSWRFLTEQIRLVGADGGVFYNVLGTGLLMLTALVVSGPIAVGVALVHQVYLQGEVAKRRVLLLLYLLNGVPSLLFGLFGFIVFVKGLNLGKSWLVGGLLLGFMILPTVTVALVERMKSLPSRYVEAAAGLGLTQGQQIWFVILPQSFGGWITGSLLGLARAAGETAPILFTATIFAGATFPKGVRESPVLSLPYHIFILAQDSFDPAASAKVWATAVVLLAIVAALSLAALPLRLRIHEEAHSG